MTYSMMYLTGGDTMNDDQLLLEGLVLELRRGLLILSVLSQLKDKEYGYSLIQKLQEKQFVIEAGTLYPLLRRLEKQGLLESTWDLVDNRQRRYYQISKAGEILYNQLKEEYKTLNSSMMALLEGDN